MGSEASLKAKLQSDLTDAIRARDEIRSGTIRMILTAITNEEVAGKEKRELKDEEIITVLSREAKKRREAVEAYEAANRPDKAAVEKAESVWSFGTDCVRHLLTVLHVPRIGSQLRSLMSEAESRCRAGSTCILPLGFRRQAITTSS